MRIPKMTGRTFETYRDLYPPIKPYDSGFLQVSDLHSLYYEQSGNKDGIPALFVHGGPGPGCFEYERSLFDPDAYRIILLDQRGSGKSKPAAELRDNTTWDAVADIERLRVHLAIDRWGLLLGGSWGSTLILAYAQTHPDKVRAAVLRGIYLARRKEIDYLYNGHGLNMMIPEFWEKLVDFLPPGERRSVLDAYYRRLTSNDPEVEREAARRWCRYEIASSSLLWTEEVVGLGDKDPDLAYQFARLDSHYAANGCFLKWDTQLLDDVEKIRHIPATIVQGRYDINCPPGSAWDLHKRWPEAELTIAPADGHSEVEPGIRTRLLDATDKYKKLLAQGQQKTIML